ncbi:MAG: dTMP kinase [Candidatus Freyarchaeota archaeon]|nr:dTMP kinase [Candidatus Freyrarchaeum guaymaensis]HDO80564.1 dTMP kinase [Candidatus Bathyarchaeota archaeon]
MHSLTMRKRGVLIALEGIDGAGKTTHALLLAEWLKGKGYKVIVTSEPTESSIGKLIRTKLAEKASHPAVMTLLFAADRVDHFEKLKPFIKNGAIIILDRYTESSICYQAAEGLNMEWIETVNKWVPKPDLTVLLDVDVRIALQRIKEKKREKYEEQEFLALVRKNYLKRAEEKGYLIIDSSLPLKEVQEKLRKVVASFLEKNV